MVVGYSKRGSRALALMLRREAHKLASALEHEAHRCEATQACVLILKRGPEVCVLRSSTTIAFGTERDPRIILLMKSTFKV